MAFALGLKTGKMLRNTGIVVNFKCDYIDKLGVTNIRWEQNAIKVLDTSRLKEGEKIEIYYF